MNIICHFTRNYATNYHSSCSPP
uniref:Uncharacterized protein n=1 Tax=Anguilla anguilla TaxID=7936 RepID=A0A0E9UNK2_ANGAN